MLVVLILILLVLVWLELPVIVKKKLYKELVWYVILYLIAIGLIIYIRLADNPSSPLDWVEKLFYPVSRALFISICL